MDGELVTYTAQNDGVAMILMQGYNGPTSMSQIYVNNALLYYTQYGNSTGDIRMSHLVPAKAGDIITIHNNGGTSVHYASVFYRYF